MPQLPFSRLLAIVLVAILFYAMPREGGAQTRFADPAKQIDRVVELIEARLALMPDVAAAKWRAQQPIVDEARERAVLETTVSDAEVLGLDAAAAREFFAVQIRLARAVQVECFARWSKEQSPVLPPARSLSTELRPRLDAIGADLLKALYLASADLVRSNAVPRLDGLRHPGVNDELLRELHSALSSIRLARSPTWETIRRVGVLRIGTTGDYAPFSVDKDGLLSGVDVETIEALARDLQVVPYFVRTTWSSLMTDLNARRFDIAVGGVSVTPARAAAADFSSSYLIDGKTPIARCADRSKFSSLEQIDRPGVRVIVNPGGTNERFVRDQVRRATIVVHEDNRTIFDELVASRADVMITDGTEVLLQAQRHPQLCGTMRKPLTQAGKAFLLPRNSDLRQQVDAWLAPRVSSGQLEERLRRFMADFH